MSDLGIDTNRLALSAFSVNATQPIDPTQSLFQAQTPFAAIDADGDQAGGAGQAASINISKRAQFFSKLQQLQTQDPAKYKQTLTDIADKLHTAAQSSTGTDQKFLSNLADKFQKAADGDLSALQPPQPSGKANSTLTLYGQNGQNNDPLLSSLSQAQNGQNANPFQAAQPASASGRHHHHHAAGASTQQALSSVFQELNNALSSSSAGSTTVNASTDTAGDDTAQSVQQAAA